MMPPLASDWAGLGLRFPDDLILAFVGGSQLHGAKLEGTDDTDYYGLFIEPPEVALGLDSYEHFVWTSGGQRGGNKPTDVDVCLYSLRKWARLAAKGNPSVLHFLFAKPEVQTIAWCRVSHRPEIFLARNHYKQFLGYANAQLQRLLNQRGQKDCHRPFLEEQHGYDTKYAMHIIRLLLEAKEFLATGHITLPNPRRDLLIEIRMGKYKLYELTEMANQLESEVLEAKDASPLPETVDRSRISSVIADAYKIHWEWRGDKTHPPPARKAGKQ